MAQIRNVMVSRYMWNIFIYIWLYLKDRASFSLSIRLVFYNPTSSACHESNHYLPGDWSFVWYEKTMSHRIDEIWRQLKCQNWPLWMSVQRQYVSQWMIQNFSDNRQLWGGGGQQQRRKDKGQIFAEFPQNSMKLDPEWWGASSTWIRQCFVDDNSWM